MAIDFTAATSEITISSDTPYNFEYDSYPVTWAIWVNVANFSTFQYGGIIYGNFFQTFLGATTQRNSGYNFRSKQVSGVNYFGAWMRATGNVWVYTWTPVTDTYLTNTWYHVCGVIAATTLKIYVNGVQRASSAIDGNIIWSDTHASITQIRLAWCQDGHWYGKQAEFAIWNTALSDAEILQLYSPFKRGMPLQIQSANLQGYWPLDDFGASGLVASGANTIINRSKNAQHGTPVNSPTGVGDPISNRGRIIVV